MDDRPVWLKYPTFTQSNNPNFFRTPAYCRELQPHQRAFVDLILSKAKPTPKPRCWLRRQRMTSQEWRERSLYLNRLALEVYLTGKFLAERGVEFGEARVMIRFNVSKMVAWDAICRGEELFNWHWDNGKFDGIPEIRAMRKAMAEKRKPIPST